MLLFFQNSTLRTFIYIFCLQLGFSNFEHQSTSRKYSSSSQRCRSQTSCLLLHKWCLPFAQLLQRLRLNWLERILVNACSRWGLPRKQQQAQQQVCHSLLKCSSLYLFPEKKEVKFTLHHLYRHTVFSPLILPRMPQTVSALSEP